MRVLKKKKDSSAFKMVTEFKKKKKSNYKYNRLQVNLLLPYFITAYYKFTIDSI